MIKATILRCINALAERTGYAAIEDAIQRAGSPDEVILPIKALTQLNSFCCGATAGFTVVGTFHPGAVFGDFYTAVAPDPDLGVPRTKLVRALRQFGVGVRQVRGLNFQKIREAIDAGFPVITDIREPRKEAGHWVAINFMLQNHVTLINDNVGRVPPEAMPQLQKLAWLAGARFVLCELEHEKTATAGGTFHLKMKWANVGVGKLYRPYVLRAFLIDNEGRPVLNADLKADPRQWLPGEHDVIETVDLPATLTAGEYTLAVALVARTGTRPPLHLAMDALEKEGRYAVSKVKVTQAKAGAINRPVIIFDTDMGSDVDDAGALALLHRLADLGEVDIAGVIFSSGKNRYGVGVCDAINTWYGRGDPPAAIPPPDCRFGQAGAAVA